jgi:hypothetical protein
VVIIVLLGFGGILLQLIRLDDKRDGVTVFIE